jgi:hypothetical protein
MAASKLTSAAIAAERAVKKAQKKQRQKEKKCAAAAAEEAAATEAAATEAERNEEEEEHARQVVAVATEQAERQAGASAAAPSAEGAAELDTGMFELRLDDEPPDQLMCPITHALMEDPVVATDGHTYERSAIECWLAKSMTSPKTGEALESAIVLPNHSVRSMVRDWQEVGGAPRARGLV